MSIDLHLHSTFSDGSHTPTEVVKMAKEIGLEAIALTDHDTVSGLPEFIKAGKEFGVETVCGAEISVSVDDRDVHLVCLYPDYENANLLQLLEDMAKARRKRNEAVIRKLADAGYNITMEDFEEYGDRTIARGQIAKVLCERHFPDMSPKDCVHTYLDKGQVGYVKKVTPDPQFVIDTVHGAGGKVFVAHLNQIHPGNIDHTLEIFGTLAEYGVDGLETLYCEFDDNWREITEKLARDYNLLRSGGSDFHGDVKPGLFMGKGYGDLAVPYSFLEKIKESL